MKSVFSDKATGIIRAMLSQPDRKWVVRDFENEFHIGRSRAAAVVSILRRKGFVGGISSGRLAYSVLINRKALIEEWCKFYSFDLNRTYLYYSSDGNILPKLKKYFERRNLVDKYALTLHTGANFITNYVNTQSVYCYLNSENFEELLLDLRQALDLKELKIGGNVFIVRPYYKKSIFLDRKKLKGYNIVSYLQLYLDLYNFPQRGREHAQYLLKILKEEGESFA
ncbi:MAG: hypothetical protein GXO98_05890 [Nitrospirae bacterium]|nr:hypothetical protein [Nitrospirota bacterium]